MNILTAYEYIQMRRATRPRGCTLEQYDAVYNAEMLIGEWKHQIGDMFKAGRDAGETVRRSVLKSMEQHIGTADAYRIAQSLAKSFPAVFPDRWWEWMEAWQQQESRANYVVVKFRR